MDVYVHVSVHLYNVDLNQSQDCFISEAELLLLIVPRVIKFPGGVSQYGYYWPHSISCFLRQENITSSDLLHFITNFENTPL